MKLGIVVLFLAGCFLLYYGGTMLLLVPGAPGEAYLSWDRIQLGVLPLIIALGTLAIAGRLWARTRAHGWPRRLGGPAAVVLGVLMVAIGYGVLILFATGHQP